MDDKNIKIKVRKNNQKIKIEKPRDDINSKIKINTITKNVLEIIDGGTF